MRFRELRAVRGRPGLWLHPDVPTWSEGLPQPEAAKGGAHGRGSACRAQAGGVVAWVRAYRRGGLLRGVLPDAFISADRAVAEARALERLAPLGLAPRCLGIEVSGGRLKRIVVAVEEVPGAHDLLALAGDGERDAEGVARAAGRAVRAMHEAGVAHRDLAASNIVARRDAAGWRAWIIDFDGARLLDHPVPPWRRVTEALRLCRSLDKWEPSAKTPAAARAAFLRAALPRELRLRALRAARARFKLRARVGRRPRPLG